MRTICTRIFNFSNSLEAAFCCSYLLIGYFEVEVLQASFLLLFSMLFYCRAFTVEPCGWGRVPWYRSCTLSRALESGEDPRKTAGSESAESLATTAPPKIEAIPRATCTMGFARCLSAAPALCCSLGRASPSPTCLARTPVSRARCCRSVRPSSAPARGAS